MKDFNEAELPVPLLKCLKKIGFITPTPIQTKTIPYALKGHDILGSAQTGTGKTGAYGIPLMTHLLKTAHGKALVLLPTRELATQVMHTLRSFIDRKSNILTALLIGGEGISKQCRQLKARPHLIVGTPGRINDHLTRGTLKLNDTNFLVLDEADRMLDMGFKVQLDAIAKCLIAKRQTLMFSATISPNIEKLSTQYLNDLIRISVGSIHIPVENVKQQQIKVSDAEKYPRLLKELDERKGSILIFVKTKHNADRLAKRLHKLGFRSEALHGGLSQNKRNQVVTKFRHQGYRILVATDVAARGLDIPHIEHVINYDLPHSPEDYIHRIGRTARAGAEGEAVSFLCASDHVKWKAILRFLNPDANAKREVNTPHKKRHAKVYQRREQSSRYRSR